MMYRPFPEVVGGAVLVAASGLDPMMRTLPRATAVPEKKRTFSRLTVQGFLIHTYSSRPGATRLPAERDRMPQKKPTPSQKCAEPDTAKVPSELPEKHRQGTQREATPGKSDLERNIHH